VPGNAVYIPNVTKSFGRRGLAPDPTGGAYSALLDPLAGGEGVKPPPQEPQPLGPSGLGLRAEGLWPFGPRFHPAPVVLDICLGAPEFLVTPLVSVVIDRMKVRTKFEVGSFTRS